MDKILEDIKKICSVHGIEAAYLVGLNDGSYLSDLDIVMVASLEKRKTIIRELPKISPKIDLRLLTDKEGFMESYRYFPFLEMQLIYGKEIREVLEEDSKTKLVKMSAMFFKSFLRNYYRHGLKTSLSINQLLIDLNDFNYLKKYLDGLPNETIALVDKINFYRAKNGQLSQAEARGLLREAIDMSWIVIEILNQRLKEGFLVKNTKYLYLGKEPTIIIPATTENCRILTEKRGQLFKKLKLLYLPAGFQFVFSDNDYIKNFYSTNMRFKYLTASSSCKVLFKKVVALFYYSTL